MERHTLPAWNATHWLSAHLTKENSSRLPCPAGALRRQLPGHQRLRPAPSRLLANSKQAPDHSLWRARAAMGTKLHSHLSHHWQSPPGGPCLRPPVSKRCPPRLGGLDAAGQLEQVGRRLVTPAAYLPASKIACWRSHGEQDDQARWARRQLTTHRPADSLPTQAQQAREATRPGPAQAKVVCSANRIPLRSCQLLSGRLALRSYTVHVR